MCTQVDQCSFLYGLSTNVTYSECEPLLMMKDYATNPKAWGIYSSWQRAWHVDQLIMGKQQQAEREAKIKYALSTFVTNIS